MNGFRVGLSLELAKPPGDTSTVWCEKGGPCSRTLAAGVKQTGNI